MLAKRKSHVHASLIHSKIKYWICYRNLFRAQKIKISKRKQRALPFLIKN
nr:MAG TPA: hypothetical protein [Caudoviricetes sp.]